MKALLVLALVSSQAFALKPAKEVKKTTIVKETKKPSAKAQAILEDCDDKAKKIEEKKIETISLGGTGDAGCKID